MTGALGLLAVGAVVVLLGFRPALGQDPSMPATVCLTFEADGSHAEGACPPTVIPPQRSDSARITVEVAHADPGWIEGGFFFMRATSLDAEVVLEQPLEFRFSGAEGPAASGVQPPPPTARGEAYLPPGSYELTVYGRGCNANCGLALGPPNYICEFPITVAANQHVTIEYDWNVCDGRTGPGVS